MISKKYLMLPLVALTFFNGFAQIDEASKEAFIERFHRLNEWPIEEVRDVFSSASFQQSIVDKMNRPAEGMPWHRYRKIFMQEERYEAGVNFYQEHRKVLEQVSDDSGVPVKVILGILGVETYFGQRKGSYRVLDALYTLAFGYPKRSKFFTRELEEFLVLSKEEGLDPLTLEGSYAGAMGYCQFMPSSYRAYAKSFDTGGNRDLVNSPEDAIASVANYLKVHRWKKGAPIASGIIVSPNAASTTAGKLKPSKTLASYEDLGYMPVEDVDPTIPATLLAFELEEGDEYLFGFNNFYVITRYNHSPLYARAVWELGEEIWLRIAK